MNSIANFTIHRWPIGLWNIRAFLNQMVIILIRLLVAMMLVTGGVVALMLLIPLVLGACLFKV